MPSSKLRPAVCAVLVIVAIIFVFAAVVGVGVGVGVVDGCHLPMIFVFVAAVLFVRHCGSCGRGPVVVVAGGYCLRPRLRCGFVSVFVFIAAVIVVFFLSWSWSWLWRAAVVVVAVVVGRWASSRTGNAEGKLLKLFLTIVTAADQTARGDDYDHDLASGRQ